MKKISLLLVFIATCIVFSSCSKKDDAMATNSDSKFVGSYLANRSGNVSVDLWDLLDQYFALASEQATYRRQGNTQKVQQLQRQIDQLLRNDKILSSIWLIDISNGKVSQSKGDVIFNCTSNSNVYKKLNLKYKIQSSEIADLNFTLTFVAHDWSHISYTVNDNYMVVGGGNDCLIYLTDDANGIRWHENGNDSFYYSIDYIFKDLLY